MLLALLVTVVLPLIALWYWYRDPPGVPPGPRRVPILGSVPFLPKACRVNRGLHIPHLFKHLSATFGPVTRVFLGPVPVAVISDLDVLREAFKKDEVTDRPPMRPFHEFRYGDAHGGQRGVILSSGREWQEQRRFCLRQLRDLGFGRSGMEAQILEEVAKLCANLRAESEAAPRIDLNFKLNISIVNSLWLIMAGKSFELGDPELLRVVKALDAVLRGAQFSSLASTLFPGLYKRFSPRFTVAKDGFDRMKAIMREAIDEHAASFDPAAEHRDFIDVYLHEIAASRPGSSFHGARGLESLECVLVDLFMGGSETTSITLIWTFLFLLHHPEAQERLHQELHGVFGDCPDRFPTLEDMNRLPYTKAVMWETLRVSSVVPNGVPHYVTRGTWLHKPGAEGEGPGDYFLPKGTTVMGSVILSHLNPDLWDDPETFRPSRFLEPETGTFRNPHPTKFAPFSVGKRYCLGQSLAEQEYFLFLAGLLSRFRVANPSGQTLPPYRFSEDFKNTGFVRYAPAYDVTLVAKDSKKAFVPFG